MVNFREIMEAYPDIKIILGVRDPHRWFKSVRDSIYTGRSLFKKKGMNSIHLFDQSFAC